MSKVTIYSNDVPQRPSQGLLTSTPSVSRCGRVDDSSVARWRVRARRSSRHGSEAGEITGVNKAREMPWTQVHCPARSEVPRLLPVGPQTEEREHGTQKLLLLFLFFFTAFFLPGLHPGHSGTLSFVMVINVK